MSNNVSKIATDMTRLRAPALFYRSAREGMTNLLEQPSTWGGETRTVMLPAFIGWSANEGSGVFDPVDQLGLSARFYDLDDELRVDLGAVEAGMRRERIDVLVVVHYFGRVQPDLRALRALADEHGVLLVEDLAHGLFTAQLGGPAGRTGSVAAYSLHKMLPMPKNQGGMVTYPDERYLTHQQETAPELARHVLDYDWAAAAAVRRENFTALTARLAQLPSIGSKFELMWPELRDDEAPQTLPVRIRGAGRDRTYQEMNAGGYGMVSLYHTLIGPLSGFGRMVDLSRRIINFPVHQDVPATAWDAMVAEFDRSVSAPSR